MQGYDLKSIFRNYDTGLVFFEFRWFGLVFFFKRQVNCIDIS